jgi:hypothetical protein
MQADAVIDHRAVEPAERPLGLGNQGRALASSRASNGNGDGASALLHNAGGNLLAIRRGAPGDRHIGAGFGETAASSAPMPRPAPVTM